MNEFDNLFIALAQSNAPNAMDQAALFFYEHYEKKIKAYALKSKVAPPTEANVVVADAFLDLVETIKGNALKIHCDLHIWQQVRKQVRRILRDTKKESKNVDYLGAFLYPEPYHLHDETSRTSLDLWDERSKAILETLSPKDYQLVQAYLNETTNRKAIADALGEKEGTVRKRWHHLMTKLRKLLMMNDE